MAIMKRQEKSEMAQADDYSCMGPQESVDSGAEESKVAHNYIQRVAREYQMLRSKLSKSETGPEF